MRRRATFNLYVSLPDEYGAAELETVTEKLIAFLNTGHIPVLNATWSCPEIGKKATAPGPVLAFAKEDQCEKDRSSTCV